MRALCNMRSMLCEAMDMACFSSSRLLCRDPFAVAGFQYRRLQCRITILVEIDGADDAWIVLYVPDAITDLDPVGRKLIGLVADSIFFNALFKQEDSVVHQNITIAGHVTRAPMIFRDPVGHLWVGVVCPERH